MTTVKVIFRTSSLSSGYGALCYRVIHKREVRQIHSGYRIGRDEWDERRGCVKVCGDDSRRQYLRLVSGKIDDGVVLIENIVRDLEREMDVYSVDDVVDMFGGGSAGGNCFIAFGRKLVAENRQLGNLSAAEHCSAALNSLGRFAGNGDIAFRVFDSRLMMRYECYLKGLGLCPNTTSYYMRKLRAIYNQAVERGVTVQRNPFKHVYTGVARTIKRAVNIDVIRALRDMDLSRSHQSAFARDMFLFSFYTRGMSFVDMAYLRKVDVQNGVLCYRRRKTKQQLTIRWELAMQEIVDRYGVAGSDYLLPLIKCDGKDERRQYLSAAHMVNDRLKRLGGQLGLVSPLTMYVARHSWASIARDNDVPIQVISQGMGHDSEKTTRIYLATLDAEMVDKANNEIIKLLDS